MIDDARLFLAPPPSPHNYKSWPNLADIVQVIPESWELVVHEDVIYLFPEKLSDKFKGWLQKIVTEKWLSTPTKISLKGQLKKIINTVFCKVLEK